ncbi:MAG: DUF5011 domain-containing protein [Eubacterium sp.]|nr:DUF5011 domain-containing protein [Eubacterium sp.]
MDDNRNELEYNWKYQGDHASDYRSKYTQGFDPDYAQHAEERRQREAQERRELASGRKSTARRRPASGRRRSLSRMQQVDSFREEEQSGRSSAASGRRRPEDRDPDSRPGRSRQHDDRTARTGSRDSRSERAGSREDRAGRTGRTGRDAAGEGSSRNDRQEGAGRRSGGQGGNGSGSSKRKKSALQRRQLIRNRLLIVAGAGLIALFIILLICNKHNLTIKVDGDNPLYVGLNQVFTDPGATAQYTGTIFHFGDKEVPVTSSNNVDSSKYGTYQILYKASYKDLYAEATRDVIIRDETPPVIKLDESVNTVRTGQTWTDSYKATDDSDGDVTAYVTVTGNVDTSRTGTYTLTYTVKDSSGNTGTATREVLVSGHAINNPSLANADHSNVIYLTFDDGPGPYTQDLLKVLHEYNVPATFFVTNQLPEYQGLIALEAEEGHTVGNQTASHDYDKIYKDAESFWADYDEMDAIIERQTGEKAKFMRFPGGSTNTFVGTEGLMNTLTKQANEKGLTYFDWNFTPDGNLYDLTEQEIYDMVVNTIEDPKDNQDTQVFLCHDTVEETVNVMSRIIEWLLDKGYVFLPVTENTPVVHFTPEVVTNDQPTDTGAEEVYY